MKNTLADLLKLKPQWETIRSNHNLDLLVVYGSVATGQTHPQSDIDIGFIPHKDHPVELLKLIQNCVQLVNFDDVDVVDLRRANPLLQMAAFSQAKLLAGDQTKFDQWVLSAYHRYDDYKLYLHLEAELLREKVQKYVTT